MTNKYFLDYISKQFMLMLATFMGLSILSPVLSLVSGVEDQRAYFSPQIKDNVYFTMIVLMMVLGVIYIEKGFTLLMSIYPYRRRYLHMLFTIGPIGCLLAMGVAVCFRGITRWIEYGVMGEIVESFYFSEISFLQVWMMLIFALVIGLLIGAIFYRLRVMTAVGILLIIPMWIGASVVSYLATEGNIAALNLYWIINMGRSILDWRWQLIYSFIGGGLTYLLLYKAPIRQYAHDLA